jgi:hypothetical protein
VLFLAGCDQTLWTVISCGRPRTCAAREQVSLVPEVEQTRDGRSASIVLDAAECELDSSVGEDGVEQHRVLAIPVGIRTSPGISRPRCPSRGSGRAAAAARTRW